MRKYKNIIEEFVSWYYKRTQHSEYDPRTFFEGEELEVNIRKGRAWKKIMDLCYGDNGLFWFTKFILGDLTYAGYPEPIKFNRLWLKWAEIGSKGDHICIQCPRQHGKSTFWTVMQSVYRISMFENYNILIESASEDQAIVFLGYIMGIIDSNEFLKSKMPKTGKWSGTEIHYNGGKIVAKGIGSEVRGGTYDYIIVDDILRSDNKLSDDDIERFVDEELEPMILVRKGQMVIVGTRKSETDIFASIEGRMDENVGWKMFVYQAVTNWDKKEILCPERFTWSQLMAKRAIMGRIKFDKEFQNLTYSSGSQLFTDEIRRKAMDLGKRYKLYAKATPDDKKCYYYIGVDCARAGTASSDFTVATVLAYNPDTQLKRIVWVWKAKGLKISEQIQKIAELSKYFDNPVILVEKNNMGQDLIDQLVDSFNVNVEAFTTTKTSKDDLIRFLITTFEHEKIIMPMGDEYSRDIMNDLNNELSKFVVEITKAGNEVMKGSGRSHDDMVMSLALANRCTQSYGYTPFAVSFDRPAKTTELERYALSGNLDEIIKL